MQQPDLAVHDPARGLQQDLAVHDPARGLQQDLASLWERNLGTPVGVHDDYFFMGGDSLLATQLLHWIREQFAVELSLLDLFEHPTVAAQAELLARASRGNAPSTARPTTDYRFFGSADEPLFGVLHPSAGRPAGSAVVLCYPIGQEYMRSHRTYVELARCLAATGQPVLRFDYYGCGDSAGGNDAGSLARWRNDISTAVREARAVTGAQEVHLVGARIGANLALEAAASDTDVASLVLWEPIVHGGDYIAALRRVHADLLASNAELAGYNERPLPGAYAEFVGFPFSQQLYNEVAGIDLLAAPVADSPADVLLLANSDKAALRALAVRQEAAGGRFEFRIAGESDGIWLREDRENKGLIPTKAVQVIVSWISERMR